MVQFSEISPSEFSRLYQQGMSISEIANRAHRSYTYVRSSLAASKVLLRTKRAGFKGYVTRHQGWHEQFIKYRIDSEAEMSDDKILFLTMIATEGYTDRTSLGFTNGGES